MIIALRAKTSLEFLNDDVYEQVNEDLPQDGTLMTGANTRGSHMHPPVTGTSKGKECAESNQDCKSMIEMMPGEARPNDLTKDGKCDVEKSKMNGSSVEVNMDGKSESPRSKANINLDLINTEVIEQESLSNASDLQDNRLNTDVTEGLLMYTDVQQPGLLNTEDTKILMEKNGSMDTSAERCKKEQDKDMCLPGNKLRNHAITQTEWLGIMQQHQATQFPEKVYSGKFDVIPSSKKIVAVNRGYQPTMNQLPVRLPYMPTYQPGLLMPGYAPQYGRLIPVSSQSSQHMENTQTPSTKPSTAQKNEGDETKEIAGSVTGSSVLGSHHWSTYQSVPVVPSMGFPLMSAPLQFQPVQHQQYRFYPPFQNPRAPLFQSNVQVLPHTYNTQQQSSSPQRK